MNCFKTSGLLMLAKLATSLNLALSARLSSSTPFTDSLGMADIGVVNDQTVSYVPTPTNWASFLFSTADEGNPVEFRIDFGAIQTINTVYIAFGENNMSQNVQLYIGDTLCWTASGAPVSQWIKCSSLSSRYLTLTNSGAADHGIDISEIMVFQEYLITPYSAVASSSSPGSVVANTMALEQALTTADSSTCFKTNGFETTASIVFSFKANIKFDSLVLIGLPSPVGASDDFISNTEVDISEKINGAISHSGYCSSVNANPWVTCNQNRGAVVTLSRSDTLAACSVGFLTAQCGECASTKISNQWIDPLFYSSPSSLIISSTQSSTTNLLLLIGDPDGVSITVFDVSTLPNSLALVCGDPLTCGKTVLILYDTYSFTEIDLSDPAGIASYDNSTNTLTFKTSDLSKVGSYDFTLKARLADYPEIGYFEAQTDFTVQAAKFCTIQDLADAATGISLTQGGQSINTFEFWAYKDFATNAQSFEALVSPLPTCDGYASVTYTAAVTTSAGTTQTILDSSSFSTCQASYSQSCIMFDGSTLSFFIFDESLNGLNTVSIFSTFTAFNGINPITNTVRTDFWLQVNSCLSTTFTSLALTSNPSGDNIFSFDQLLTDPATTFAFTVSDTVSSSKGIDTYCGGRYAVITADDTNPLTTQLLSCIANDCISLTTSDGYTFALTVQANDMAFDQQILKYKVEVYLSQFQAISAFLTAEPVSTSQIAVQFLNPYCTVADLSAITIMSQEDFTVPFDGLASMFAAYTDFVTPRSIGFEYFTLPTCRGFDISQTTYSPVYSINATDVFPVLTDIAGFDSCVAALRDVSCIVFNQDLKAFQLYVQNEEFDSIDFLIEVEITFVAPQFDGSLIEHKVKVANHLIIYSCRYSSLPQGDSLQISYNSLDVQNRTFFTVYQNAPMPFFQVWLYTDNYYDLTMPYNDTDLKTGHCGRRKIELSAKVGDPNYDLANVVIGCTTVDCLKFEEVLGAPKPYISQNLKINMQSSQYLERLLKINANVQLQPFLDLPPDLQLADAPQANYEFTLWFTNLPNCETEDDLLGITFYDSTLQYPRDIRPKYPIDEISYFSEGVPYTSVSKFAIGNYPKCYGFDFSRTTYHFDAHFNNDTIMRISQDPNDFATCKQPKNHTCMLYQIKTTDIQDVLQSSYLEYYVQDESITMDWGTTDKQNYIYEYANAYATLQDGTVITKTYLVDIVEFRVYTCRYNVFRDYVIGTSNFVLPVFDVLVGDKKQMTVNVYKNHTMDACGPTWLTIQVSPLNQNPALAQSLIDCTTACFKVYPVIFTFYTFTFDLKMTDVKFVNQHLIYDVYSTNKWYNRDTVQVLRNDWPYKIQQIEIHPMIPNQCNISSDLSVQFYSSTVVPAIQLSSSFFFSTAYSGRFFDVFYQLKNLPTCFGFQPQLTTLAATIAKSDGTTEVFMPDSTTWWNDCVVFYTKSCFALDQVRSSLKFFVFDESVTGTSQVTFSATLWATNADNILFSSVISKTYDYTVKSCGMSIFSAPTVVSSSFSDPLNWAYNINSHTKTFSFTINDSKSIAFADSTYCGGRTITLKVASSETNTLATQLLQCAPSCLKATTDATGYILSLSLAVSEVVYANQILHFTYSIQFTPFASISQFTWQPFYSQDFAVHITHDTTCAFIEQLQDMVLIDSSGVAFNGQTFSNYAYLDFTSGPQVVQLQAQNLPTCIGFQSPVFDLQITKADGTAAQGIVTQALFDACVASKAQSCFYIDSTFAFNFYVYDTSFLGINTISFVPTMSGYDSLGVMTVYTYTLAESSTVTLNLIGDCLFTVFQQPEQGSVVGMPDIKTNLLNPLPPTIFSIEDSLGIANTNPTYCGGRYYSLESTDSNPLSLNLLSCVTNCLKLTSSVNTLTISLNVVDRAYLGLSLPFTLIVSLQKYYSIPEAPNPTMTYQFNAITFAHDSCMSAVFNSAQSKDMATGAISPLNLRAQVKGYSAVIPKDPYNIANFEWRRYYIQTPDTVAIVKSVPTYCGGRDYQLKVSSNETNPLAAQLLSNLSTSQMYITPYDDYTYLIALRILEDSYTGITLSFNLTIWLHMYHSNHTIGEPSSSINLLLTIDPCVVQSTTISPVQPQTVQYYVNTVMAPIQFAIYRVPNCQVPPKFKLQAQSITNQTLINSTYGVHVTGTTTGYNDNLMMWVYTESFSLVNTNITLALTNLHGQTPQQFGIVTLEYLCKVQAATLTPATATSYIYQIGTVMSSLQYYVLRNTSCSSLGEIEITVTIDSKTDSNYQDYGLIVSQSTNGALTQINLASYYNQTNLNGMPFELSLSYLVDDLALSFATITVVYVDSLIKAKITEPPYFTAQLTGVADIPCLDKFWTYKFPETKDPNGYPVKTSFTCTNLQKALRFDDAVNVLTLNPKGVLPAPGGQDCKITLSNPTGAYQNYQLSLFVICNIMSNGTLWNWTAPHNKTAPEPPLPTMQTSSRHGDLYIYWNKPMIQTNLSGNYSNQVQEAVVRKLQDEVLKLVYTQESDPDRIKTRNLNYTYDIFWVNSKTTEIKITYQNPQYVSAQISTKDKILVTFTNPMFFQSTDGQYVDYNVTLETSVPKQIAPGSVDFNLDKAKGQQMASAVLISILVLSCFLVYFLNKLLSLVENMVIIMHYFILTLNYPANVQDFFAFLFPLVIFDALPVEGVYQDLFDFENIEDPPITEQFEAVGYGNTLIVQNMGSFWLVTNISLAVTILITLAKLLPVKFIFCCYGDNVKQRIDNFIKGTYWNGVILFIDANYLCMMMMAMIGLTDLRLGSSFTYAEQYNSLLTVFVFIVLVSFPFVITLIYGIHIRSSQILPDPHDGMQIETIRFLYKSTDFEWIHKNIYTMSQHAQFMAKYGALLEDINFEKLGKWQSIFVALLPVWHKLLIVVVIMATLNQPVFAILAFNLITILMASFIYYYYPFTSAYYTRRSLINQAVLLIVNYHLYGLTEWQDIDNQIMIGDSAIRFVIFQFIIVAIGELIEGLKLARLHCIKRARMRRWLEKKKLKKAQAIHIKVEPTQVVVPAEEAKDGTVISKRRKLVSHSATQLKDRQGPLELGALQGVNWQANFHQAIGHVDNQLQCIKSEGSQEKVDSSRHITFHPDANFSIYDLTPLPDSAPIQLPLVPKPLKFEADQPQSQSTFQIMVSESSPLPSNYFFERERSDSNLFTPQIRISECLIEKVTDLEDQLQEL